MYVHGSEVIIIIIINILFVPQYITKQRHKLQVNKKVLYMLKASA